SSPQAIPVTVPPKESGEGDPGQVTRIAEEFIRLHEAGQLTDLDEFCARYPEHQREKLRQECERLPRIHVFANEQERLTPGQTLASYKIVELIGAGGMGEVYRARDSKLDRRWPCHRSVRWRFRTCSPLRRRLC
ncbi:MAG: hypothetical protein O7A04_08530, partial [Acidobacteria bacterium]|nr:hypothetical protein [Acidobacteriota bacterium]